MLCHYTYTCMHVHLNCMHVHAHVHACSCTCMCMHSSFVVVGCMPVHTRLVLSSGSVISLSTTSSSPSKGSPVKKSRSIHSPASYRPSSAETPSPITGKGRRITSKTRTRTPQSPLRHSIRSKRDTITTNNEWTPINLEATPGGESWEYYSYPVAEKLAVGLSGRWPATEKTFVKTLKQIFQALRDEREHVCQYFFLRRYIIIIIID